MKCPMIGITVSQKKDSHGLNAAYLPSAYAAAIRDAGGLPVLIPNEFPLADLKQLLESMDGILIPGGGDIDPAFYGEETHPTVANVIPERDALEKALIDLAIESDKPLFCICRGHQMLNVALGGTLYTHIPDQFKTKIRHDQPSSVSPSNLAHEVVISPDTRLASIMECNAARVNSRHHQAIKEPAARRAVTAYASDGLIEAVELPQHRFCIGVQWHPEGIRDIREHGNLFTAFIAVARR